MEGGDGDVVRDVVFNRGEAVSAPTVQGAVAVTVRPTVTVTVTVAKLCLLLLFRTHHGSACYTVQQISSSKETLRVRK